MVSALLYQKLLPGKTRYQFLLEAVPYLNSKKRNRADVALIKISIKGDENFLLGFTVDGLKLNNMCRDLKVYPPCPNCNEPICTCLHLGLFTLP
ncbi:hypothetical protein TNCV_508991 [Trichonephila clavipes]|nr:hypothetical protein TNCV_508991 [Trichonephila clavipes]